MLIPRVIAGLPNAGLPNFESSRHRYSLRHHTPVKCHAKRSLKTCHFSSLQMQFCGGISGELVSNLSRKCTSGNKSRSAIRPRMLVQVPTPCSNAERQLYKSCSLPIEVFHSVWSRFEPRKVGQTIGRGSFLREEFSTFFQAISADVFNQLNTNLISKLRALIPVPVLPL